MRPVLFLRTLIILLLAGYISVSCENELDPQSPGYRTLPVVYGVLNLQRDTLGIRVTKTFSAPGSALDFAQIADSVYFPDVRVWLEKWNGDFRVNRAELTKTGVYSRLPGIFPENPNWNYILVRSPETETIFTGSVKDQEYHLTVEIPGLPLIFAKTSAYPGARLTMPRLSGTINLFLNPLEFSWKTDAPYSELYFRLNFTEVYRDSAVTRSAGWREYHTIAPGDPNSDQVFGQDIMKRIAGQIKPDNRVLYRHITSFQAVVAGIPSDLFDYRLMSQVQPSDQAGFIITNIINGIGLFTSQTISTFDLDPDPKSRDSIMFGQFTKALNLRYY
jgi:hypothetical protein